MKIIAILMGDDIHLGLPGTFSAGLDVPYLLALKAPELQVFWRNFIGTILSILESRLIFISAISGIPTK